MSSCSVLIRQVLVLYTVLASLVVWADVPVAVLDPATKQLKEDYKDEVPVSGRVVAGLSLAGLELPGELAILPSQSEAGARICVQVMSRDGRYWAENNFVLPEVVAGAAVHLRYESRYLEELNLAGADDLALLSFFGSCDADQEREYVLTSRAKLSSGDRALIIYVNSARADTYAGILNRAQREKPQRCRVLTEGRRTGYDTICELALREGDSELDALRIKIFRRKYEKSLRPVELTVRLPL